MVDNSTHFLQISGQTLGQPELTLITTIITDSDNTYSHSAFLNLHVATTWLEWSSVEVFTYSGIAKGDEKYIALSAMSWIANLHSWQWTLGKKVAFWGPGWPYGEC